MEDWHTGDEIDDDHIWVGWQDGHGPGLKALVNKNQRKIEDEYKLLACKHASSTSTIQQMADVCCSFAIAKQTNKTTTAVNLPSGF